VVNIVALNNVLLRDLRVRGEAAARFGDGKRFVPLIAGEFSAAAAHYPILLTKDSNTGAFFAGAMLGIDEGENLFLSENGMRTYRPLNLQRGAFFISGEDVAIDLDSPRIDGGGEGLFADGKPTPYLESMMQLFRDLVPGTEVTRVFIETLVRMRLVEPIDITLSFDDGSKRILEELYTINQEALRNLGDIEALDLFRRNYLFLIYLVVGSLKQIPALGRRKNDKLLAATSGLA
jgi:hypothetical protein